MTITAALVLYAVIWFMILFICLPINLTTQEEAGEVIPGTPASAPENGDLRKKIKLVTLISLAIWILTFSIIVSGIFQISDFDIFGILD